MMDFPEVLASDENLKGNVKEIIGLADPREIGSQP